MNNYFLIVFKNTHDAIEAEKVLKEKGVKVTIMPTPTYITQSCGISIKLDEEFIEQVKDIINEGVITIKNVYHKYGSDFSIIM